MKAEDKLRLPCPVLVEGKYDKIKLSGVIVSPILTLDGFSVFRNDEKKALLRAMCANGVIVLTDSDRAGFFLRSRIKGLLPDVVTHDVYIPRLEGKEKRKDSPSKDNLLGVEGMEENVLYELLLPFASERSALTPVTKADMYALGLSGAKDSTVAREKLCRTLGLPESLGTNAIVEYINSFVGKEKLLDLMKQQ